ncbi:MAG: MFS transporter [Armatimonadetes bacterium]|nr:MFS transporter [Armatimonadota bacterium]
MVVEQERAGSESEVERRNFRAWVAHQAFYRIGWQFKMEATMIAGLVSFLSDSAKIIGVYSTASSVGRWVGPVFTTPWIDRSPSKKRCLMWLWGAAVFCWAVGTLTLWTPLTADRTRTLWWFFIWYTLFFTFLGAVGVAQGALLGKIVRAERRGAALSRTHTLSGPPNLIAILVVWALVRHGWFPAPRNYALAFSITTLLFVLAGVGIASAREKPTDGRQSAAGFRKRLSYAGRMLRTNRDFRLLMWVQLAMGFGGAALSFYTAYGRQAGSIHESSVVLATVLQVLLQTITSSWLGNVADRKGNRIVICWMLLIEALTPVSAVLAATLFPGSPAFLIVYCLVGARFPLFQLLVNYLLEIVPEEDQALALGVINMRLAVTMPAPLLFGAVVDWAGYAVAMLVAAGILAGSAVMALFLREPRVVG